MSKTDKTDPWWHQATEWKPDHSWRCANLIQRGRWVPPPDPDYVCDLPDVPPKRKPIMPSWKRGRRLKEQLPEGFTECGWQPVIASAYSRNGRKIYGIEKHVHEQANHIERRIRMEWRVARQQLLGTMGCYELQPGCRCGLDEDAIPDPRHRHYAIWNMW